MFCSPETPGSKVLSSEWGNRSYQGSHCRLTVDSPPPLSSSLEPGFFLFLFPESSLSTAAQLEATHTEVHKQRLICFWILHPLSQASVSWVWASVLEPVLSNLAVSPSQNRSLPWPCQSRSQDQNQKYLPCWQIPGWVSLTSEGAPPPVPHCCVCWAPLPSPLPAQLSPATPALKCAQSWNSLQLLVPSPSLVFDPEGQRQSKSHCLLSFHPHVSIARPGWIPQSYTEDHHAWVKGYGTCCSVDPCHKKNG